MAKTKTKPCARCKIQYPATPEVYCNNKGTKDKIGYYCPDCRKAYIKEYESRETTKKLKYEYYKSNKEKHLLGCKKKYIQTKQFEAKES